MKSLRSIQKIAQSLVKASLDDKGEIDEAKILVIADAIYSNDIGQLGISLESIQRVALLKAYLRLVRNQIVADSLTITTAMPMNSLAHNGDIKNLIAQFQKKYVRYRHDKTRLGGITLQFGWNLLDLSLQHKLDILTS